MDKTQSDIPIISELAEISHRYDLLICDLWGVMHDGVRLNSDAAQAILDVRRGGGQTIFLSNAPRPRYYVREHLTSMGLEPALCDYIVTSGGLARDDVRNNFTDAKLYHLGPEDDRNTIAGLPVKEVDNPDEAEVIFATGLDFPEPERHGSYLSKAAERGVPLLCANPDRVVHVGERLFYCAGSVADIYAEMGGEVHWFGKPMPEAFAACKREVGMTADTAKLLMIGDSLKTDIAGANAAHVDSLLVAAGIHRDDLRPAFSKAASSIKEKDFKALFQKTEWNQTKKGNQIPVPSAIIPSLK